MAMIHLEQSSNAVSAISSLTSYPDYKNHARARDNDQYPSSVHTMDEGDDPIRKA
jgi:hypothetical protein